MYKLFENKFSANAVCPRTWTSIAGVSGAIAICMGAYAAHSKISDDDRHIILRANNYHLLNSVAILALSNSHPISACLITTGTVLFCGSLYAKGLFAIPTMYIPPLGGIIMILGWLSIAITK